LKSNFIGGEWVAGQDAAENVNPSDTRDVIGVYARAGAKQAMDAVAAAHAAVARCAAMTPQQRADALDAIGSEVLARKVELADLLAR
jgi:aldehyde dehydrogenase (NAD+)